MGAMPLARKRNLTGDVKYVDYIKFLKDWKIIFETIEIVLRKLGISSGTSATMEEFMGSEHKEVRQ